ncbi:hypothetical protein BHU72_14800 [Desulfuribacillus stibiiarsenatis]|uniref:EAL domain-containing protein n=1 Tax=Desulfuribacillus stibiiarsenatis TaxID=1390249 RepID=A0A1E5L7Q8_9FIRM|nr:EAL domain-containing protein [Desulfuribacillus stibiiarsenatis]OEH86019.1 hypothetical protein BHU72_14800 [Desulfuribacillus stibiiarsenatis]
MKVYTEYQPIIELKTNKIMGYEALLRGSELPPEELFQLYAQQERLVDLDITAMKLAIDNFVYSEGYKLFLNCHPETFVSEKLLHLIQDQHSYVIENIVLEITERAILNPKLARDNAKKFKKMGMVLAIDDFGQGQSYFHNIEILEPNIIKLDKSLIANICNNEKSKYMIIGLQEMANKIEAKLIAEGIETREVANVVKSCGIECGQGWFFGRPERFIHRERKEAIL